MLLLGCCVLCCATNFGDCVWIIAMVFVAMVLDFGTCFGFALVFRV